MEEKEEVAILISLKVHKRSIIKIFICELVCELVHGVKYTEILHTEKSNKIYLLYGYNSTCVLIGC